MSLLISINSIVYLIFKQWRCFFWTVFFKSGILSSFALLLGLTGSWIISFPVIKVSKVFFLLFLQVISCWYEVTLDTLSLCLHKTEMLIPSLFISISDGFRPWFISFVKCVFCFSYLSIPWFIQWFIFVRFIAARCIYFSIGCLWFLYFVDCINLIFWNGRSGGFLHHIRFFPIPLIPPLKI